MHTVIRRKSLAKQGNKTYFEAELSHFETGLICRVNVLVIYLSRAGGRLEACGRRRHSGGARPSGWFAIGKGCIINEGRAEEMGAGEEDSVASSVGGVASESREAQVSRVTLLFMGTGKSPCSH